MSLNSNCQLGLSLWRRHIIVHTGYIHMDYHKDIHMDYWWILVNFDYQDHSLRCDECKLSVADLNADI